MTEKMTQLMKDVPAVRWTALVLLASAMFFGYIFMDILSPLQELLQNTRGWSPDAYGHYAGSETFLNVFVFFLIFAGIILDKMGMDAEELSTVISAIGNHDESTAYPVNEVAAALILADKTDVRRTRVRNTDFASFDMHDRVNYAVVETRTYLTPDKTVLVQEMTIDTQISPVMDYFEIFLDRMLLCRKAAERLGLTFRLRVNGQTLL